MVGKAQAPEIKKLLDKRVVVKLNGNRKVTGILRGFDPFLNVVLEETVEETGSREKHNIGMVVIRGNSISMLESLDRVVV